MGWSVGKMFGLMRFLLMPTFMLDCWCWCLLMLMIHLTKNCSKIKITWHDGQNGLFLDTSCSFQRSYLPPEKKKKTAPPFPYSGARNQVGNLGDFARFQRLKTAKGQRERGSLLCLKIPSSHGLLKSQAFFWLVSNSRWHVNLWKCLKERQITI